MKQPVAIRELINCAQFLLSSVLPLPDDPIWNMNTRRQGGYLVHRDTRSIVFKWLDNNWAPGAPVVVAEHDYAPAPLSAAVLACAAALADHLGGYVVKLMVAELRAGGNIPLHCDTAPALTLSHRCHVPIVTNPNVRFTVDGSPQKLKLNIAYELDNTRPHSVQNEGNTPRVHLICDIMPFASFADRTA